MAEKNKEFELRNVLELPLVFWCIQDFSLPETSTAIVFLQDATKLAEQRFGTDYVTASRYSNSPICRSVSYTISIFDR